MLLPGKNLQIPLLRARFKCLPLLQQHDTPQGEII